MGYEVGKPAGEWVRKQSTRRERQIWLMAGFCIVAAALIFVLAIGHALTVFGSVVLLATAVLVRPLLNSAIDNHFRLLGGTHAEEAVGETLNQLVREGWTVMHDIERGPGGNIDHLASGPGGVFMIETKARRYADGHLGKAKWQAKRLHDDEFGVWVVPVICLHRRSRAPFKHKGVWIVPHEHLLDWLRSQHNAILPFERLARFADSL
jgi:hypothetical protein